MITRVLRPLKIITNILLIITTLVFASIVIVWVLIENNYPVINILEDFALNKSFLPTVISIQTLIISVALPLSIQIASRPNPSYFINEVSILLFEEISFKLIFAQIPILILLLIFLFFFNTSLLINLVSLGLSIAAISFFRKYLKVLIRYSTAFKDVLSQKAQLELDEII